MNYKKFIWFLENNKIERKVYPLLKLNIIHVNYLIFDYKIRKTFFNLDSRHEYYILQEYSFNYEFFLNILIEKKYFNIMLEKFNLQNEIENHYNNKNLNEDEDEYYLKIQKISIIKFKTKRKNKI